MLIWISGRDWNGNCGGELGLIIPDCIDAVVVLIVRQVLLHSALLSDGATGEQGRDLLALWRLLHHRKGTGRDLTIKSC